MRRSLIITAATVGAMSLALAGCAKAPDSSGDKSDSPKSGSTSGDTSGGSGSKFKACMVSDSGGFDDKSFNQTSHKGLVDAKKDLGIKTAQVESNSTSDYAKNLQSMVDAHCKLIVTVGNQLSDDTVTAAKKHPDVDFAIVDSYEKKYDKIKNLKGLIFNTAEPSFLAGYLAASQTKTDKVGTYGGKNIPTVTIFMDGFAQGVQYYNKHENADVKVLGWNPKKQDGDFVGDFEDTKGGLTKSKNLVSQGADILMPVGGPSGDGALQEAKASGGKVDAIWVDTDGCISAKKYCSSIMTSVGKAMDVEVKKVIEADQKGHFSSKPYVGDLKNKGVELTPYHQFDSKIPDKVQSKIDDLKSDIVSGKIKITSKAQPSK